MHHLQWTVDWGLFNRLVDKMLPMIIRPWCHSYEFLRNPGALCEKNDCLWLVECWLMLINTERQQSQLLVLLYHCVILAADWFPRPYEYGRANLKTWGGALSSYLVIADINAVTWKSHTKPFLDLSTNSVAEIQVPCNCKACPIVVFIGMYFILQTCTMYLFIICKAFYFFFKKNSLLSSSCAIADIKCFSLSGNFFLINIEYILLTGQITCWSLTIF